MNKLTIAATALFLASTAAAHAGNAISFEIDGQHIRIETPRNCASLNCVTIVAPGLSDKPIKLNNINLKGLGGSKDNDADTTPAPATSAPPAPAPVQQQPAQQAPIQATAPAAPAAPAPTTTASAAPAVGFDNTTQPASVAAPVASAPAPAATAANTPIGVWAVEDNKGNVRVEQCGTNLCGYAEKNNERILIDMKPEGSKWSGRIHDPESGKNYDSTIALKSPNALRVQGCALGGMICGGQTWKRVS